MAHTNTKCPRCGRGYGSATHAKRCRGLAGSSLRAWRARRNESRRNSRSMAKAVRFSRDAGIIASASFYGHPAAGVERNPEQPQPEVQS